MHEGRRRLLIGLISTLFLLLLLGSVAYYYQGVQQMQQAQAAVVADLPLEASQHYERAAGYFPWRTGLWELGGRYALQAGDYRAAVRLLEEADRRAGLSRRWKCARRRKSLAAGACYRRSSGCPGAAPGPGPSRTG
jgi:hypothetical protein